MRCHLHSAINALPMVQTFQPPPLPIGTDPPYQSEVRALFLDLPTLSESVLFCKDLAVEPTLPPSVGHLAAHITTGMPVHERPHPSFFFVGSFFISKFC